MIRLLLFFVLSPVLVFCQTLRYETVDSIKAVTLKNFHTVSAFLGHNPGTQVERVDVIDSGEYVTVVMRIHVARKDTFKTISSSRPEVIKTGADLADCEEKVSVPHPPLIVAEVDLLNLLSLVAFKTWETGEVGLTAVTIPPLPAPVAEIDIISPLSPVLVITADIVLVSPDTAIVPPLPPQLLEVGKVTSLPLLFLVSIKTRANLPVGASSTKAPRLPPLVAEVETITEQPMVPLKTGTIAMVTTRTAAVPPLPHIVAELDTLTLRSLVIIKTRAFFSTSVNTVTVPALPPPVIVMPVTGLHLSEEGYSLLEKLEGFSPDLYSLRDGGLTIGFGFFLPNSEENKWDKGMTLAEAERIIKQKVPAYEDQVKRYINVPVTQSEFDALTMLAYNLGGFSKATSIVNDINNQEDADKLQSDWSRFVHSKAPGVARGLANRRKDELGVKKYSDYQPERKLQIIKMR